MNNSENIKEMIELMKRHEKNITLFIESVIDKDRDKSKDIDTDISMNLTPPIHTSSYIEYEYGAIPPSIKCYEHFKETDPMIVVKSCGHGFRKEPFMEWIKTHHTCMQCASLL
jgi:hypothetical protein